MRRSHLRVLGYIALALVAGGVWAGGARPDGLPVVGVDAGSDGVASTDGAYRYVTLAAGSGAVIAKIQANGGRVERSQISGRPLTIPAVAYDGSADGLSADGSTLALIEPRVAFPRASTRLVVFAATDLRPRRVVDLGGDFSFDAISPDGRLMYLIEYMDPLDPTVYAVRAYDTAAGRLLPKPIRDPDEPAGEMGGAPQTRAWSADRRWAFTLYRRGADAPFIHALDTAGAAAKCIDLDMLPAGGDLANVKLQLSEDGAILTVVRGAQTLAQVDLATFTATGPASPSSAPAPASGSALAHWPVALSVAMGVGLLGLLLIRRLTARRRA